MNNLILFDQDTLHYRQSIYIHFREEFAKLGYNLVVVYDNKLNKIEHNQDLFIGVNYSFKNCNAQIKKYKPRIIIQFVWLKYKFLFPFMMLNKIRGIKSIVWSHGINMQNRTQKFKNQLYYLRQRLADALIIYTPNEVQYIVADKKKLFIANNTLNYYNFPKTEESKEQLKAKYGYTGKKIVLCVGRLSTHDRKVDLLFDGFCNLTDNNIHLVVVGTGVTDKQQEKLKAHPRSEYMGAIFDQEKVNEIYKMSDIFVMPGGVGLAINHAYYFGLPVLIEDVNHSPEAYYLKEGYNGYIFNKADANDLAEKINLCLNDDDLYNKLSNNAKETTVSGEASFQKMIDGFVQSIKYVEKQMSLGNSYFLK